MEYKGFKYNSYDGRLGRDDTQISDFGNYILINHELFEKNKQDPIFNCPVYFWKKLKLFKVIKEGSSFKPRKISVYDTKLKLVVEFDNYNIFSTKNNKFWIEKKNAKKYRYNRYDIKTKKLEFKKLQTFEQFFKKEEVRW